MTLATDPGARVAHADVDATAVLRTRELLGDDPRTVTVHGDPREPASVLGDLAASLILTGAGVRR